MKTNLTLVIEDELLLQARRVALDRRTTVNQLVRGYLTSLVDDDLRLDRARANLKAAFASGIAEIGPVTWERRDLYER